MDAQPITRISTGIAGLDEILNGGLIPCRAYLIRGDAGVGKSILGFHFLDSGAKNGEDVLYISLQESRIELQTNAKRMGFDVSRVNILDLSPSSNFFKEAESYDIFLPAEVERESITKTIIETIERIKPTRIFVDPVTQFRYLSVNQFHFRKQFISFLRFISEHSATILFTSETSTIAPDDDLKVIVDGIIRLGHDNQSRSIVVQKIRGSDFAEGPHTIKISDAGITVYPRMVPGRFKKEYLPEVLSSGIPELDELLSGGLERGTVTMVSGPSGVGKTTFGMQFIKVAAGRGERSVVFSFEEDFNLMLRRFEAINIPAIEMTQRETLSIQKIESQLFPTDEFASRVRYEVEKMNARVIMIDSLSGYDITVSQNQLVQTIHVLSKYLQNMGVAFFLIADTANINENIKISDVGISYLADNIVFLRYLEIQGEMRKAIGVLKKRLSDFEKTLREFQITRYGIKVGKPLVDLQGIFSAVPQIIKPKERL